MNEQMKPITDEDLTLLYYGEHDDPGLAACVADSPELSERFETLGKELSAADVLTPPERGEDYGAEIWRRIASDLGGAKEPSAPKPASWWQAMVRPRFSFAGAAGLAVVAVVAFMLGRGGIEPGTMPTPAVESFAELSSIDGNRLLIQTVAGHLEQLDRTLTSFALQDTSNQRETDEAMDLLVQNRIYRRSAQARGDTQLATFLSGLEPILIEIAYHGQQAAPATRERMQAELRDGVLFRVRVLNNELNRKTVSL